MDHQTTFQTNWKITRSWNFQDGQETCQSIRKLFKCSGIFTDNLETSYTIWDLLTPSSNFQDDQNTFQINQQLLITYENMQDQLEPFPDHQTTFQTISKITRAGNFPDNLEN